MSAYSMVERAKWHNRKALAIPLPPWPHSDPRAQHHARCFVMLSILAREGRSGEFMDLKKRRIFL